MAEVKLEDKFLGPVRKFIKDYSIGFDVLDYGDFLRWIEEWGISRGLVHSIVFLGLLGILSQQIPQFPLFTWSWLVGTAPIWLPVVLWITAWATWVMYVRNLFLSGRDPILLELRVPREIMKSPRAMEMVLSNFWINSGEVTYISRAWKGSVRPFFSFEMASFGGQLHLYVWCWKSYKNIVEAAFYAQYPNIELREVDDYAMAFEYDENRHNCFVTDYIYEPRGDEFPIKSYLDFELDRDPKDEYRIDPLAQVFEVLSSIKPHEQMWLQILIRKEGKSGILIRTSTGWAKKIDAAVKEIRKRSSINPGKEDVDDKDAEEKKKYGFPRPTWGETRVIETLERHKGKLAYEVGIRAIYIADGPGHGPTQTAMRWIWRAFNSPEMLNGLRPRGNWGHNVFDYPWQDWNGFRERLMTRRYLDAFRRRSYFYEPWITRAQVMSSETIASIFHPPSATIETPGLTRIPATKSEPPANLPM